MRYSYSCYSCFLGIHFPFIYYITIYILISYKVLEGCLHLKFLIVTTVTVTLPLSDAHSLHYYLCVK